MGKGAIRAAEQLGTSGLRDARFGDKAGLHRWA
ncbi:MAG: hypothetical protein RLZZ555_2108 [Pseudomonadota bacterium]|jgi:hypothetical protein